MSIARTLFLGIATTILFSCDINDEIPYPIVYGNISEFVVDGQCTTNGQPTETATIDKNNRTITINVADTVNIANLRVKKIGLVGTTYNPDVDYQESPELYPDSAACANYAKFPKRAFDSSKDNRDYRMNFTDEVKFIVRTYQDYEWTVKVNQIIEREIEVENQVGNAVIDAVSKNDFYAYVDFKGLEPGTYDLPVKVTNNSDAYVFVEVDPKNLNITLVSQE